MNSDLFFNRSRRVIFISLVGYLIFWQSTAPVNSTRTAHMFFSCSSCHRACCHSVQTHTDSLRMRGSSLRTRSTLSASCPQNSRTSSRHVIPDTTLHYTEHVHSFFFFRHNLPLFFTLSSSSPAVPQVFIGYPCADPQRPQSGFFAEPPLFTAPQDTPGSSGWFVDFFLWLLFDHLAYDGIF